LTGSAARVSRVPLALGLGVFLGLVALLHRASLAQTGGAYTYPLDDTYIHLAIARSLADAGVYGVTPAGFTSASSSIGWPLVLAAARKIAGERLLAPLALNVLAGAWLVVVVAQALEREGARAPVSTRALWVLLVVGLAPLPTLALLGMEHTLHAALALVFALHAADWLAAAAPSPASTRAVAVAACAAVLLRYESLFLVGAFGALAVARGRLRAAAPALLAGALPVALFGAYAKAHGWPLLPASVLLKGTKITIDEPSDVADVLFGNFLHRIATEPHMIGLLFGGAVVLLLAMRRAGAWAPGTVRMALALIAACAHVELGKLGWFFRYEAYLVVLVLVSAGLLAARHAPPLGDVLRGRWRGAGAAFAIALAGVAALGPLVRRALQAAEQAPVASRNIFEQQVQTARFFASLSSGEPAAVNDIGAVAYFAPRPIVDLVGLASLDVARAKRFDIYRPLAAADVERFAGAASVAVVYDEWVPDRPPAWTLVGRWSVDKCRSCYRETVSIYVTRPSEVARVEEALRAFAPSLPRGVKQEGRYLAGPVDPSR
jgi:hypothetical protein